MGTHYRDLIVGYSKEGPCMVAILELLFEEHTSCRQCVGPVGDHLVVEDSDFRAKSPAAYRRASDRVRVAGWAHDSVRIAAEQMRKCGGLSDELIRWGKFVRPSNRWHGQAHGTKRACVQAGGMTRLDNFKG
ncbi:hypothetical protein HAX54_021353 [Datura stramonium]|uniref:Uncharacterized protein n=1 Tax=Datura stramonium TaxID=4076 RepID=A0ABS8S360_DATST|nr:hypothetical protein [Datura stramonium]